MATEVYTTEEIRLLDDTEVEIRPLSIAKLRKFTRMWGDHMQNISAKLKAESDLPEDEQTFTDADLTDAQFDIFIKLCAFGLDSLKGDKTDKQFNAYLEDVLDEKTIYRVLWITGGLKLGEQDPNLLNPANPAPGAGMN